MPPAEVVLDEALVRRLLHAQHPDLAGLPLRHAGAGWDNETWRLGEDLAVRLPRREVALRCTEAEHAWLGPLATMLPVAVPAPVRLGERGEGYPWPWSVVPWFAGTSAEHAPLGPVAARELGTMLRALHVPAPARAPRNPHRSAPLAARASPVPALAHGGGSPAAVRVRIWERACRAPVPDRRSWVHGDLHARNLIVARGRLRAVIDWGDMAGGDPAVDLSVLWTLLDPSEHQAFCSAYGPVEGHLHVRARGWALVFGVIFAGLPEDEGAVRIGTRTLERLMR